MTMLFRYLEPLMKYYGLSSRVKDKFLCFKLLEMSQIFQLKNLYYLIGKIWIGLLMPNQWMITGEKIKCYSKP